jgi:hypothetical protein
MSVRPRNPGRVVVALALLLGSRAVGTAASPRAAILGTWRGTSTCVKSPEFPACHDEVVVYEFRESSSGSDAATLEAFKIVNGEKQSMGEIEFTRDAKQGAWVSEFTTPRVHVLWTFVARGDEITGTLVDLPSKHLIRNVAVKRQKP